MKNFSISVVIPVYNEIELLKRSIPLINSFLKRHFGNYEIIVVESGSTDGSFEQCEALAKNLPRLRLIHEGAKNGYGSALFVGFAAARYDLIWPVTVDLPFKLETILRVLPLFANYDCVLSFRTKDNRRISRKIMSFAFNEIVKLVLNLKVRHVNSAFKVFRRKIFSRVQIASKGWFFDAEFVYRLYQHKIDFVEIGVGLLDRRRGKSTVGGGAVAQTLLELWQFMIKKK